MEVAVLTYEYRPNSIEYLNGIPRDWPAIVHEPPTEGFTYGSEWVFMTKEDYDAYCAERQAAVDAWRG